ncbi:MAG: hypothetical protein R3D53_06255 [Paracoccaceae bacterium]
MAEIREDRAVLEAYLGYA